MPLIASSENGGGDFQLAPAGSHIARCVWVIDLGTQHDSFQGKPKIAHKVRVGFELPLEKAIFDEEKGEEPYFVGKEYTLSLDPKATLRKDLESWRGMAFTEEQAKRFDVEKLISAPTMLTVQHGASAAGRKYAKIASLNPLPKGTQVPPQINASVFYTLDMGENDVFRKLPSWIKSTIIESEEWTAMKQARGGGDTGASGQQHEEADTTAKAGGVVLPF